jgi:cellulose synthase operon protein C
MKRLQSVLGCALLFASYACAATPWDACKALKLHGKLQLAETCYARLTRSPDSFVEAEGYWGLAQYDEANSQFRIAYQKRPDSAEVRVEWGRLLLERFNPQEAESLFQEALKINENYAPAYVGLARVYAAGFDKRAVIFAQQAIAHDPKLVEAHELLAYLALEDNNAKAATEEAQKALAQSDESLEALAVLASTDWLNGKAHSPWMDRVLKIDPAYGEAYATGAHFLVINRRYDEGIRYYRMALQLNSRLWAARSQLGVNLMRLGLEDEAKQQLEQCYDAGYRDAETVNSLRLLDTLKDYETFKSGTTVLMLRKDEAALLRPYIEPELRRAIAVYEQKYKMKLPGPVRLEVYPNHDDFVVRTLGLPGQGGLMGVTFGLVVAMDSPSARPPGELNWASTMWHELSHVYVVTATHNMVPRWFTEGLAVHEETAASPDWGDRMTPSIVMALQKKQLLPVADLDTGFVRPEYPNQVIVSYFEAGKICDYIAEKWGDDSILSMIHSFADRKTTAEAIQESLHETPAAFDKQFLAWLNQKTGEPARRFDEWKKGIGLVHSDLQNKKTDDAIREGLAIRNFYPEYVGEDSVYELLSRAYISKSDKTSAIGQLEAYRDAGGTNLQSLKQLAALEQDTGNTKQAQITLHKLNYIFPADQEIHSRFGDLLLKEGNANGAIREYEALIELKPADAAQSHYQLAKAFSAARRINDAKDQVLLALEAAPNFKPAQQLLLELNK